MISRTIIHLALLCCVAFGVAAQSSVKRTAVSVLPRRVVLTTDIGAEVDDQWALAHLAVAPEIELSGVVTTHAPSLAAPAAQTAARVARNVLDLIPSRRNVPLIAGSNVPLESRTAPLINQGVEFLLRESQNYNDRDRLAILVIGAATDTASALLADPTFADRIEIIAMAFDKYPQGGDSWNVKNDVTAWQVLLASRAPITVGDAAVTKRNLLVTRSGARSRLDESGAVGGSLVRMLDDWIARDPKFCLEVTGEPDAWVMWDQVVIAHLLKLTATESRPRPVLSDDMRFAFQKGRRSVVWITGIDSEQLWSHFARHLERVQKQR